MLLLKHLPSHRSETMQIIAQTPHGIIKGVKEPYDEEKYQRRGVTLERINELDCYWFTTDAGQCYMSKAMIDQSIIFLAK